MDKYISKSVAISKNKELTDFSNSEKHKIKGFFFTKPYHKENMEINYKL